MDKETWAKAAKAKVSRGGDGLWHSGHSLSRAVPRGTGVVARDG